MKSIKPIRLYLKSVMIGFAIDLVLLMLVGEFVTFKTDKSENLFWIGISFYLSKAIVFFAAYLLFFNAPVLKNNGKRNLIIYTPFILFLLWFTFLILFQVEDMYGDLSYGSLQRFPHFYLQLLATFLACIIIQLQLNKKYNRYS